MVDVDGGPLQHRAHVVDMAAFAGRNDRHSPEPVDDRHVRVGGQQHIEHRDAAGHARLEERRVVPVVQRVRVGAGRDQHPGHLDVVPGDRDEQRRPAAAPRVSTGVPAASARSTPSASPTSAARNSWSPIAVALRPSGRPERVRPRRQPAASTATPTRDHVPALAHPSPAPAPPQREVPAHRRGPVLSHVLPIASPPTAGSRPTAHRQATADAAGARTAGSACRRPASGARPRLPVTAVRLPQPRPASPADLGLISFHIGQITEITPRSTRNDRGAGARSADDAAAQDDAGGAPDHAQVGARVGLG